MNGGERAPEGSKETNKPYYLISKYRGGGGESFFFCATFWQFHLKVAVYLACVGLWNVPFPVSKTINQPCVPVPLVKIILSASPLNDVNFILRGCMRRHLRTSTFWHYAMASHGIRWRKCGICPPSGLYRDAYRELLRVCGVPAVLVQGYLGP